MSTINNEVTLKVTVCAVAALALTLLASWSFVESTATAREPVVAEQGLGEILIIGSRTVAQN